MLIAAQGSKGTVRLIDILSEPLSSHPATRDLLGGRQNGPLGLTKAVRVLCHRTQLKNVKIFTPINLRSERTALNYGGAVMRQKPEWLTPGGAQFWPPNHKFK